MSNFTPGPWEKKGNTIFGNGRRICDLLILYDGDWQPWAEEQEANARLIATAPELYEACKTVEGLLNGLDSASLAAQAEPRFKNYINLLRDVLAKAEKGGSHE